MRRNLALVLSLLIVGTMLSGVAWAQATGLKVTTVLQASTTPAGQPIQFPLFRNQFIVRLIEMAPGSQVGRHMHPIPVLLYIMDGEFTVEAEGQPARTYKAGQAAVEVVNTWHNGFNRGTVPAKFLVIYAGEEGRPTAVSP